VRLAAIEYRDLVPAAEGVANLIRTGKTRPAQNKNAQRLRRFLGQQISHAESGPGGGGGKFDELTASCLVHAMAFTNAGLSFSSTK